jgi:RNA polymerase sigma-70 factor (ECF subfamily)
MAEPPAVRPLEALFVPTPEVEVEARPSSVEGLLRRHAQDLHRLVWRLMGPGAAEADVEDLCQQISLALYVGFPKFRGDSKPSTWMYGVASRLVYRELRRRTRHRQMVRALEAEVVALMERPSAAPEQETRLQLAEVWRRLMRVHPKKRVVFILHELEGLTGREIAEVLKIKEPTVHTRLFHARRELARALEASR